MLDDDDDEDDGTKEEETETKPLEEPGLAELGLPPVLPHFQTTLLTRGAEQGPSSKGEVVPMSWEITAGDS